MSTLFRNKQTHELFTSTKTTVSTVLDSDGVLKNTLNNLLPSTDLSDTAVWTHTGLDSVVASGTGSAGKTRYLLTEDTSTGNHRVYSSYIINAGVYTAHSIDFESNGRDLVFYLSSARFGTAIEWLFDATAETVTQVVGGTKDAAFITPLGGNEYRLDLYAEATSSGTGFLYVSLYNSTRSYTGDGSSGVYLSRPRVYRAAVHAPVERVTNGDFANWTADDPDDWTVNNEDASNYVTQHASGARIVSNNTAVLDMRQTVSTRAGEVFRVAFKKSNHVAGAIRYVVTGSVEHSLTSSIAGSDANGTFVITFTATSTAANVVVFRDNTGNTDYVMEEISVTKVITNGMQTDLSGSDYVETSGSAEFHAGLEYDGNGALRGLQAFEGRTNLVAKANEFDDAGVWGATNINLTAGAVVGPDGDLSAYKLYEDSTTAQHYINDNISFTSGTTYVFSVIAKAAENDFVRITPGGGAFSGNHKVWFNLATGAVGTQGANVDDAGIKSLGNGWYQCWTASTATTTASTQFYVFLASADAEESYLGDGTSGTYLYSTDCQAGSSPSPYIPTNGSTVSRGADLTFKALSEFGFKQDQYTVVVEFESAGSDGVDYPFVWGVHDGTSSNRSQLLLNTSSNLSTVVVDAGVSQSAIALKVPYTSGIVSRVASAFKSDDFSASDDGDVVVTDTSGSMPPVTNLALGYQGYGTSDQLNGYIKYLAIYPARLTDATLVAESA